MRPRKDPVPGLLQFFAGIAVVALLAGCRGPTKRVATVDEQASETPFEQGPPGQLSTQPDPEPPGPAHFAATVRVVGGVITVDGYPVPAQAPAGGVGREARAGGDDDVFAPGMPSFEDRLRAATAATPEPASPCYVHGPVFQAPPLTTMRPLNELAGAAKSVVSDAITIHPIGLLNVPWLPCALTDTNRALSVGPAAAPELTFEVSAAGVRIRESSGHAAWAASEYATPTRQCAPDTEAQHWCATQAEGAPTGLYVYGPPEDFYRFVEAIRDDPRWADAFSRDRTPVRVSASDELVVAGVYRVWRHLQYRIDIRATALANRGSGLSDTQLFSMAERDALLGTDAPALFPRVTLVAPDD